VIKQISFYKDGKRVVYTPGPTGLFTVKVPATSPSGFPTITLEDGKKLRVYHAGNSHIPIVHPSLVIEQFDEMWRKRRTKNTSSEAIREKIRKSTEERKEQTTQPMNGVPPIIPPPPKVKVANGPPQKSSSTGKDPDPFAAVMDSWYGCDDDDPNDGLYDGEYPYPTDEGDDW
jgi:hypothetical protein